MAAADRAADKMEAKAEATRTQWEGALKQVAAGDDTVRPQLQELGEQYGKQVDKAKKLRSEGFERFKHPGNAPMPWYYWKEWRRMERHDKVILCLAVLLCVAIGLAGRFYYNPSRQVFYEAYPIVADWDSGIYHARMQSASLGGPCEWVDRISLGHVVDFPHSRAAARAGYRPCKACFGPGSLERRWEEGAEDIGH